jgi:polysaccharide chain length determinant protein (PEP-CTERM system associated)
LSYVYEALLGQQQLEQVADETGLNALAVTAEDRERVLRGLRSDIRIDSQVDPAAMRRENADSIYTIRYRHVDRDTTSAVVTALLTAFVENTLSANQRGSDTAELFLDARIEEYETRLRTAEEALADFKKLNADRLPGTEGSYFDRIRIEQEALREATKALRLAESRREQLLAQLNSESPVVPSAAGIEIEPPPNSIDGRIASHRADLDRLLLAYTDRHPEVVAVRDALQRLEAQRAEQLRALGMSNTDLELSKLDSNPVFQAVQIALNETAVEIAALDADVRERTQNLEALRALVDDVPEVEAELARLNRDYNVVYDQYQAVVESRETQDLTRKAYETDQVEFRVIDPPIAGLEPVAPDRLLMLALVLGAGFGAAAGVSYVIARLKPVFADVKSLSAATGLPVLGCVQQVLGSGQGRRRLAVAAFICAMAGLPVLCAIAVSIEIMGPGLPEFLGSLKT